MSKVGQFKGIYAFLSNFHSCWVPFQGVVWPSAEHAYQAAKTDDAFCRRAILNAKTSGTAKKLGQKVPIRDGWETNKYAIMYQIVLTKFQQNPRLKQKLLATGSNTLEEGNKWHDTYWGVDLVTGRGQNNLGEILMRVRDDLRKLAASPVV